MPYERQCAQWVPASTLDIRTTRHATVRLINDSDVRSKQGDSLSERVLEYSAIIERAVRSTKEPGSGEADWTPLAELVATDEFQRVGIWLEQMDWPAYVDFLNQFASAKGFETTLRRITECSNLVFYEIEERHIKDGKVNVVNSMNAYEFDDEGKIRRLDVYIQGVVEPSVPVEILLRRSGS
jgi:hypothetical protein